MVVLMWLLIAVLFCAVVAFVTIRVRRTRRSGSVLASRAKSGAAK